MSATHWATVVLWAGAIPTTLFVAIYGLSNHWWRSWIGRALLVSTTGLALLFDLSLLNHYHPLAITLTWSNVVVGFVALGGWLKLVALLTDKWRTCGRRAS